MSAGTIAVGIVLAILMASLAFLFIASRLEDRPFLLLGALALAGHVTVSVALLRFLPYNWDIVKFSRYAKYILQGDSLHSNPTVNSYAAFQAVVYSLFGVDPTTPAIFNGLVAVLVALPLADLGKQLYPELDTAIGVKAVALFAPLPFLFLSLPMRDSIAVFLFFLLLTLLVRGYETNEPTLWLPAILIFGMEALLRPELAGLVLLGIVVGVALHLVDRIALDPLSVRAILGIGGGVTLVALPIVGPHLPVNRINSMMTYRTRGGAAYLHGASYSTWWDMLIQAPSRALYFQFAPFPLHVNSGFDLLAALMTPIVIVFAIAAYRSVRIRETNRPILFGLLAIYIGGILGYGLVDANFGTTVRHRIPFTFLLVVFAAPVIEGWAKSIRTWIGQLPRDDGGNYSEKRETREFECGGEVRTEYAYKTSK